VAEQLVTIKNFCTQYDTHLWLIAHPTKLRVAERGPYAGLYAPPTLYDTSGSAHFYNTADMGLCVWRNTETNAPETEIHIQKVRFEENGMTGKIELFYDKYTKRYYDMGTEPVRTYAGY
jgi:twinkle protein